ncbi:MAG: AMP-binding protein [Nitrospirae bacterium]|nr:AMP-binding protein [Nitrospirota bacterium]MBI3378226.1 AMP-binding protein [Nitrospirota bacterium]
MTLVEMLEKNAREFPEKKAIVYHDFMLTYRELNETVNRLTHALLEMGFKKGGRVAFMLPRIPELVITFLSAAKAHGIAVPINFELPDDMITAVLNNITPRYFIVHKQFLELAKRAVPRDSEISIIVAGENYEGEYISLKELQKDKNPDNPCPAPDKEDIVYLNYTSGSTGNPKGAVTTHSNIYWNTIAAVDALKLTPDDIHLCIFAPFAHPHEIFSRALYLGGTMVLVDKIYPKAIAEAIANHKVTTMMGLSPMYETLIELVEHRTYDLSSLRVPESGGMYTRIELIERFRQKTGVPIIPVWGSTETTGIALANRPNEYMPAGSVGKPCASYEVKIVDENDNELPDGEIGEMIFRGPAVIQNYYGNPINGKICFKDGWYCSGDLGRRDRDGNFYFADRKTGMMKVAGLKVYPLEIELVLMSHPDIKEAAVIPAKDRLRGEVPKAIIVTNNGTLLTEKEILGFCKERLPHYKLPRIIEIRASLPKIGSGKINKRVLQLEAV